MCVSKKAIEKCKANIFNYAYHPYMIVSIEGEVLDCNSAALDEIEVENKSELIGRNLVEFFPKYQADGRLSIVKMQDILEQSRKDGFSKFEWQHRDKHSEIVWGEISLTLMSIEGEELMFFSWYDIHEKKVLEHHYELSQESKIQFLSNISHEIRTPMNAIMGFSELLHKSELSNEQKKYTEAILNSSQELLYLLNDVLDSSKMRIGDLSLKYETVDLEKLVYDIQNSFHNRAKEAALDFKVDYKCSLNYSVDIDVKRVLQVINSLLDNSFKFTKQGFVNLNVTIIEASEQDATLKFEVVDSGIGIESKKLKHIFDLFTQEDASDTREFGGVGLGLSMSYELAKMMGGELYAVSKKGEGSSFSFVLKGVNCSSQEKSKIINEHNTQDVHQVEDELKLDSASTLLLDDFLDALEKGLLVSYDEVVAKQNFDDYEEWTNELLELSIHYKNSYMQEYAKELRSYLESFDIENINKSLINFKGLVKKLYQINN